MGKTSDRAYAQLQEIDQHLLPMQSGLVVMRENEVLVRERFLYAGSNHIEELAMHYLNRHPSKVPNGAHIVFFANWSPCSTCLRQLRWTIRVILDKKPDCRFRFRFKHYYSKEEWERQHGKKRTEPKRDAGKRDEGTTDEPDYRGHSLFGTATIARTLYDDAQREFGNFPEKIHDGERFVSPRVAFIQGQDHSRRRVAETAASTST